MAMPKRSMYSSTWPEIPMRGSHTRPGIHGSSLDDPYTLLNYALRVRSHDIALALAEDPRTNIEQHGIWTPGRQSLWREKRVFSMWPRAGATDRRAAAAGSGRMGRNGREAHVCTQLK